MAHKFEIIKEVNVTVTDQSVIDLSDDQKHIKAYCKNSDRNDDNDTADDKVNQLNMITKENDKNVDKIKIDAWRNLKYLANKQTIMHKLPFMPPPERPRNKVAQIRRNCFRYEQSKQRKRGSDIGTQTDPVNIITRDDYEVIQYIKDNGITREAIASLIYDDDDLNNNVENQSDFEREPMSQPEIVPITERKSGGEEQEVYSLIEKYSEENKAKLSNLINSTNNAISDPFTDKSNVYKNNLFEIVHNSLWQIIMFMSHHKNMTEKQLEKISCVDNSTQTSPHIVKSKKDDNGSALAASTKEITISQPSSHPPNVTEYDILEQKMQVIHGNYQKLPLPQTQRAPRSDEPRTLNQQSENETRKTLNVNKRPRLNSPETREETANRKNYTMQTNHFSSPPWQFHPSSQFGEGTCVAQQWRFNVMPPPPRYNQENRFTSQQATLIGQYQTLRQQQEISEYQKYRRMEEQRKAWESRLQNYPNSAWSHQLQENYK